MGLGSHLTMWNVRRLDRAVNTWLPSSLVPCLCPELFVLLPSLVLGPSVTSSSNIGMASNNVTMFTKRAGHCSVLCLYMYTTVYSNVRQGLLQLYPCLFKQSCVDVFSADKLTLCRCCDSEEQHAHITHLPHPQWTPVIVSFHTCGHYSLFIVGS